MTNQVDTGGPSLLQARQSRHEHVHHNHNHIHNRSHRRLHSHSHAEPRQPQGDDSTALHARLPPDEKLLARQVVIVQTVSIVHFIDASGSVTSISTLAPDPVAPPLLGSLAGDVVTAALSALGEALPTVSLPLPDLVPTNGASSTTTSAQPETSSSSLPASSGTLTSAPFSSSSAFPVLSTGIFNSSSTAALSLFSNGTIGLFSNSTRTTFSSHSSFASTTLSSSSSATFTSTTTSDVPTIQAGGAGGDANAGAGAEAPAAAPAQPTVDSGSGLPPETRNAVVGGVVGSVAGIALIVLMLLFFLKWRKQHGKGIMLLGDGDSPSRGKGPAPSGGGGGMVQRASAFAIPAALAKLTGGKRAISTPPTEPPTQEKGFYRVSGRKLISVLESGGDGFSDPHDSVGSGASFYRDTQMFIDGSGRPPLQLGSPMRPESGVPVFRDGPQRTPVHEQGPPAGSPGNRSSSFPTTTLPVPDALGRSFASRDGSRASRGSGSRFTEDT
ncbi:hypothetical protein VTK56DRAFT_8998 [Thermocarpiscus australiensis]